MLCIVPTMRSSIFLPLITLTFEVQAHSWVEQLLQIASNGTFIGAPGYARGNVLRTTPGFTDVFMTNLIPPDGQTSNAILPSDLMCMQSQRSPNQTEGSPRLNAPAGAKIALRYQENGHVTLPWNQPGKPANRGTVYVYGTQYPRANDTFLSIHKMWNANGTGGDGRGVLLSTQNFDDGRCYQINNGNISVYRQHKYPHVANQLMGANLWCQQDIALPLNIPSGKLYTLYWVWDWPTAPHVDPNLPNGKNETYTTCIDIDITDDSQGLTSDSVEKGYIAGQPLDGAAIPSEFAQIENVITATDVSTASSTANPSPSTSSSASVACLMSPTVVTVTVTVPGTTAFSPTQSALVTSTKPESISTPSTSSLVSSSSPIVAPTTITITRTSTQFVTPNLVVPASVAIPNPKIKPTLVTAVRPSVTQTSSGSDNETKSSAETISHSYLSFLVDRRAFLGGRRL